MYSFQDEFATATYICMYHLSLICVHTLVSQESNVCLQARCYIVVKPRWYSYLISPAAVSFFFYFASLSGRIDGVAVFVPAMSAQGTYTFTPALSRSLFFFSSVSLYFSLTK